MIERGVLLPPSQFETWFVSAAHAEADIDATVNAAHEALRVVHDGKSSARGRS
jgi:glutamate-1-semialdehyde 2,1-aminomutase